MDVSRLSNESRRPATRGRGKGGQPAFASIATPSEGGWRLGIVTGHHSGRLKKATGDMGRSRGDGNFPFPVTDRAWSIFRALQP